MKISLRARHVPLLPSSYELFEGRIAAALDRFAQKIRAVDVLIEDINGPRGGVDKRCQVGVVMRDGRRVVSDARHERLLSAVDEAAERSARQVRERAGRGPARKGAGLRGLGRAS